MICPNCGADIPADGKACEFCGTTITVEMLKEREIINKQGCPRCKSTNLEFKRETRSITRSTANGTNGARVNNVTIGICKDCGYTWDTARLNNGNAGGQKKSSYTWLWVLGWIFIFPVPLSIIMYRKKDLPKPLRIVVVVVAWVIFAIWLGPAYIKSFTKSRNDTDSTETETTKTSCIEYDGGLYGTNWYVDGEI